MSKSPKRFFQTVQILVKYGFEELVSGTKLESLVSKVQTKSEAPSNYTVNERIRMALEDLGTTYIKFGQILSQRTDLLPRDLIHELKKLQDRIKPAEIDVEGLFMERYGKTKDQIFSSFNDDPIGIASIGQVYEGTLLSGEQVVIKIKKPGVDKLVRQDLELIKDLIGIIGKQPKIKDFRLEDMFASFKTTLLEELNYHKETNNIIRFKHLFAEDQTVYVPDIYPELCNKDIICMEFIDGIKIDKLDELSSIYPDPDVLTRVVCDYYFDQIFDKGYYHADPHPGNVQILKDGKVCLLDYGMTGTLLEDDRIGVGVFFFRIINKDTKGTVSYLDEIKLGGEIHEKNVLEYELDALFQEFEISVNLLDTEKMFNDILALFQVHKIVLPKYFFNLLRTIALLDGIMRLLSPEINTMELIKPYAQKLMLQKANPGYLFRKMFSSAVGFERNIMKLPTILNSLLSRAADGELSVGVKVIGLEESVSKLERISNRLILAILVGCLLVASSLVVLSNTPPYLWGIPMLGVIGYILSAVLAIYIIIKSFRK